MMMLKLIPHQIISHLVLLGFEVVEQSALATVVQTNNKNIALLLPQTQHRGQPVKKSHFLKTFLNLKYLALQCFSL